MVVKCHICNCFNVNNSMDDKGKGLIGKSPVSIALREQLNRARESAYAALLRETEALRRNGEKKVMNM